MSHHTRGRKAAAAVPSEPISDVLPPPKGFSKAAAAEWRRVMPVLAERRVLSEADLAAVEAYARAVGDAADARAAIAEKGAYLMNARGELKRHPAFATLREATAEQRRWAAELGLTPASRSRVANDAPDDDVAEKMDL